MVFFAEMSYYSNMPPTDPLTTRLDRNGRIVLPAAARKALGIEAGDELVVEIRKGSVRLRTFEDTVADARAILRDGGGRPLKDLSSELLALRKKGLWDG